MSEISKELGIFLVAGSIPERKDNKFFNTSTIWGPKGDLLATYRKMHLFDIDIPGEITFKESDSLTAGSQLTMFDVKGFKIGVGICYDIRFEELAKLYRKKGCNVLIYPGAFNMKTGPLHWELLARSRANDNQCYTALVSPARDVSAGYVAWGHSMVVDPWGKVLHSAGADEEVFVTEIGKSFNLEFDLFLKPFSNPPQISTLPIKSAQTSQSLASDAATFTTQLKSKLRR